MSHLSFEDLEALMEIMNRRYAAHLKDRRFAISITEPHDYLIHVTVTLANAVQSYVYPVEARMDVKAESLAKRDAILQMIDYIDHYFEEFFREDELIFIPIDWTSYTYDDWTFQLRGQILNKKAEAMADAYLEQHT